MGNPIAKKLRSYAIARHHAYVAKDRLDQAKAQAVSHIIRVCDHFKEAKQNGWINQIREDVLKILPSEEGKFRDMRIEILSIMYANQSHAII
jgi:hypothetical protein